MSRDNRFYQFFATLFFPAMAAIGVLISPLAVGEVIHIPVGQQAPELRDISRPVRGMTEGTVLDRFGEPNSMSAPVGEPPISKWSYDNYTVYFESSVVIHSVLTHTPRYPNN